MSGFEPGIPWPIQFPHKQLMPDLTPPFSIKPPVARIVKKKSPIFCERYLHHLYCGALLENGRRSVTWGNVLKPGYWLPPPSSAQNHLCAVLSMTLWLQKAPQWLYQLERPTLVTVWARAAVAAEFWALAHPQSVWVSQTQPLHLQGWTAQTQQAGSAGQAQSLWQHLQSASCRSPGFYRGSGKGRTKGGT